MTKKAPTKKSSLQKGTKSGPDKELATDKDANSNGDTADQLEDLSLNEAQIYNWLTENPEFLLRNEDLLAILSLPERFPEQGGGAISLHQRQLQVLRDNNNELEGKLIQIVENAKSAQSINQQLFSLATLLIEDVKTDKPVSFLNERIRSHFDLISVRLVRWDGTKKDQAETVFGQLYDWLGEQTSCCDNQCNQPWVAGVFGDIALQVKSVAIVSVLEGGEVKAMLALGAKDPQRFQAGMAVEALDQLGALVSPLV